MEQWKDISGYEGLYQVSDEGRVRSLDRIVKNAHGTNSKLTGKEKAQAIGLGGYLQVCLSRDGKAKSLLVHRLVAEAFAPNPEEKREVNHIDGNKHNNRLDNLEWVTSAENKIHAYETGLNKHYTKPVRRSDGVVFGSVKEAAQSVGISKGNICTACNNQALTSGGYRWEYITK